MSSVFIAQHLVVSLQYVEIVSNVEMDQ